MLSIILAVVILICGFVAAYVLKTCEFKKPGVAAVAGIVLAAVILVVSCVAIVPTGYTGILTTFGKVEDKTLSSGINIIAPWQKVINMDNRTQKVQFQTAAFSSDIQQVDLVISVNYCIDQNTAQTLYKTVGENYYDNVMFPRIQENTKAIISQYTAENLIAYRNELSDIIASSTSDDLAPYGITIVSISIEDIDFTDAFTNAVEAKQVATQNKLTAETQQAQRTMEERAAAERAVIAAEAEAEQAIIAANAESEVARIQAEAALYASAREAEANQMLSESLTEELIRYYWIKSWNGELPATVLSSDSGYMIDLR